MLIPKEIRIPIFQRVTENHTLLAVLVVYVCLLLVTTNTAVIPNYRQTRRKTDETHGNCPQRQKSRERKRDKWALKALMQVQFVVKTIRRQKYQKLQKPIYIYIFYNCTNYIYMYRIVNGKTCRLTKLEVRENFCLKGT